MATVDDPKTPLASPRTPRGLRRWRWTVSQYRRLVELGLFDRRRVQLVDGEIIEMAAHRPAHGNAVELLDDALRAAFGAGYRIRIQLPLETGRRSQPEPDAAVFHRKMKPLEGHPSDAVLVVEVSDTTLNYDRLIKAHLYACAGIPEYWVVNLKDRQLEVHLNPGPDTARKGRFTYHDIRVIPADGHVTPRALTDQFLLVADLLP